MSGTVSRSFGAKTWNPKQASPTLRERKPASLLTPFRLPASIKAEAEKLAKQDGVSLDPFVATAVAEKVSAPRSVSHFVPLEARADLADFDRIMNRTSGLAARGDDEPLNETQVG